MPLVRINLPQDTQPADMAAIFGAVHKDQLATFNAPEPDKFQAIHRHDPEELVCTPEFLGVQTSRENWSFGRGIAQYAL